MTQPNPTVSHDWFRRAFDALYPVIYAHRTVEAAEPEAAFAARALDLRTGDAVLDVACGNGRHLAHLLERAPGGVGLDYSEKLLALARRNLGPQARLVRADMRAVPFRAAFDAVTSFFTSFGYFFTEAENLRTVQSVAGALRRGGRFFLDYLNRSYVENNLVPRSRRRVGDYEIAEERWIDTRLQRINKNTVVYRAGEKLALSEESVQLYTLDELRGLLGAGGLLVDRVFGDFDGTPYDELQPRMIVVGHKA